MMYKLSGAVAALLLLSTALTAQKSDAFLTAMYMEKWDNAVNIQEEQCKKAPDNALNWFYMADAYNAASRPVDAQNALQKAAQYAPKPAYQSIVSARLALLKEHQEEAVKLFKKASKSGKKDIIARRLIGESWLYGRFRDLKMAESLLIEAQRRNNRDFQTHLDLGYCYRALLDGGKALTQLDIAQNLNPKDPLPALMSAMVYKSANITSKQLEFLDKAITIDPTFEVAVRQKGEFLYYQKRDYEGAVKTYAQLLEINPKAPIEDKMAYVNSLFLTKKYEPTILWVDKIIGEDGSRNYLRRLSAYSYYETEHYEEGKAIMDEYFSRVAAEKIIPQDYEYYAKFMQKENQDSLAAIFYEKAIELDSSRWDLYNEIGSIRYNLKDYLAAATAYEHLLDSIAEPKASDYYKAGLARYMIQDSANYVLAADYFAKVSDIVPDKSVGWLMQAKSLAKIEPDLELHPEQTAEFGKAKVAFEHYAELAEKEDQDKEAKDLIKAYEYLAYYYILQKDKEKVQDNLTKLKTLDASNTSIAPIADWIKTSTD